MGGDSFRQKLVSGVNVKTKNAFLLASGLSMMMLGTQAFAASTIDLTVDGSITPAACTPSISGGGVINIGNISAADLSATNNTTITIDTYLDYSIICNVPTLIAHSWTDNRVGSTLGAAGSTRFGLGRQGAKNIGQYAIRVAYAKGDGNHVEKINSKDNGISWVVHSWIYADNKYLHSFAATGTDTPERY